MTGQTLLHYRILEKIGEGGMGAVYKARDTHLDRVVAVKFLPAERLADPDRRQRFVQEAKAASSLNHPNIIVIHDIASDAGRDFIVMEYVDGKTLDQLIGRKGMKLNEALGVAVQVADGLAKAHAAGIVHRDLKPSNVMVTPEGRVKILDFGLAKLTEEVEPGAEGPTLTVGRPEKPRTEEGFIIGTVAYMSPEQAEGRPLDSRSDIFAFGALLYEMLTGSKAFRGETRMSTLAAILREEPKPATEINEALPADIEPIIARCLRKDPQRRWQNMSDLRIVLQDLKEDSESGKLRAPIAAAVPARRKSRLVWILPAALVLAAAVLLWLFIPRRSGPPEYEITRLTFDSGITWAPSFSPDGKMFAYASDRGGAGNQDIWLQQIAGGAPLRLTTDPARDMNPSFSADGSKIVFNSAREGGGIFEVGILGGEARRLGGPGFVPRCSPDGAWISYVQAPASPDSRLTKMFLIPAQGGAPVPFQPEFSVSGLATASAPVWSPDGKYIIFNGRRADDPAGLDWWVAPTSGGPAVRTGAHSHLNINPVWGCPYAWVGSYIYYGTGTTVEGVNLFRARIEKNTWKISGPAERITSGAGMQYLASVLADGRMLYANLTWISNICTLAARPDQGEVDASLIPVTKDLKAKFDPALSRDGSKLIYGSFSGLRGQPAEVRLVDLATGSEKAYPLKTAQLNLYPRISPDGSVLSYREREGNQSKTYIIALSAATPREVCDSCFILGFYADAIFALTWDGGGRLFRQNTATGEKTPVLEVSAGELNEVALSADDRWLALTVNKPDGRMAMYIAPLTGGPAPEKDWIPLFDEASYLGSPAWSPDGTYLYYLSERQGACAVWVQKLDPRSKRPEGAGRVVFRAQGRMDLNMPRGNATVSVGRDKLAVWTSEAAGNIYLATPKKK